MPIQEDKRGAYLAELESEVEYIKAGVEDERPGASPKRPPSTPTPPTPGNPVP